MVPLGAEKGSTGLTMTSADCSGAVSGAVLIAFIGSFRFHTHAVSQRPRIPFFKEEIEILTALGPG